MPKKDIELVMKFKLSEEDYNSLYMKEIFEYFEKKMLKDMKKGANQHNITLLDASIELKK